MKQAERHSGEKKMADGRYIGLARDSKIVAEETNQQLREMLAGVPDEQQPEVLEKMLDMRALRRTRAHEKGR